MHTFVKAAPYEGDDRLRRTVDIRGGEAKQADPGIDEAILASVVLDQRASMCAPVVLKGESNIRVVEIRAAKEPA